MVIAMLVWRCSQEGVFGAGQWWFLALFVCCCSLGAGYGAGQGVCD